MTALVTYNDADFSGAYSSAVSVGTNALRMQVRKQADDATVWAELTSEADELSAADVTDGSTITIEISHQKLLKMPPDDYVFSVIMWSQDTPQRTEVLRGTISHNAGPTRWNSTL